MSQHRNTPGDNLLMGCMAILKNVEYVDFVMEIEAQHDDNDASGIIFGMTDPSLFYQTQMMNDDWPDDPSDFVPGPHLKISKKNGLPCLPTMTPDDDCYDLLAYTALDDAQPQESFPQGRLASVDYYPAPYEPRYDPFKSHNFDGKTVRYTLIVYQGAVRVYFQSRNNKYVGVWADLPPDYRGGRVGVFTAAHQQNIKSITIVDLSPTATPMTHLCKEQAATCDTSIGLCVGGSTPPPTSSPTSAPTYYENCRNPFRHAASDVCPDPVGGAVVNYDVSDLTAWELIDQPFLSTNCSWEIAPPDDTTIGGLRQTSNAWGNAPSDNTLLGCIALIPDSYTDFIAEFEAVHFDNDGWGFVFGFVSETENYIAHTINDVWPGLPTDGIKGPNTKLRKTTGLPCVETMDADNSCYETLGYTDKDGYSDYGSDRVDGPRSKEYEFRHSYAASADWQPHKITLIVQGQEARLVYKSPDVEIVDSETNATTIRQGNRYQSAQSFNLKDYSGGRLGIWCYAHQLVVESFKVTDLSDPSNLPTAYCGGTAYCDEGITGLCLGVAAAGACEGAVDPRLFDPQDLSLFEFIDDPTLDSSCSWGLGTDGYLRQSSNANRYDGTMLGCSAMLAPEYTDFAMEMRLDNQDNDAVGFNFGWLSTESFFRVHKINDVWVTPNADGVTMPVLKIRWRIPGTSCAGFTNASNPCFETIGFVDQFGSWHQDMHSSAVTPAGECGYSNVYLSYDQSATSKMYLIVKDNQVRATFESPLSRRQVTVMNFDLSKYNYRGGRVGIFVAAHQASFFQLSVGNLAGGGAVTQFCGGDVCSERTGRCLGSPTIAPTASPTHSPTAFPLPNVAANSYCQGPVSATATTTVDTTDLSQFLIVDHPMLTTACNWSTASDGLSQNSEAWGNVPGDNTLMGCMAMYQGLTFTDFIAQVDISHLDNDGWGLVFGYNAIDDQYLGIAMNDRWPLPAADGIGGPFLKLKKHNGKLVRGNMDAKTVCFDTLAHLDSQGFDRSAMEGLTGVGIPKEYTSAYPYSQGAIFEDTTVTLIVKGQEARLLVPTPPTDVETPLNRLRQAQTVSSVWTSDLQGYSGGFVGVFTSTEIKFKILDDLIFYFLTVGVLEVVIILVETKIFFF